MNLLRRNYKVIIGLILGIVLTGSITYAATISSSDVKYSNTSSGLSSTNIQGAIDEVYTMANDQYFDLVTAKVNTSGKVFASKKGVCIIRNQAIYCFKVNNWSIEKSRIQQVFSDVSCNVDSSVVYCETSDFRCGVKSDGAVYCDDLSDPNSANCSVNDSSSIVCH